MTPSTWFAITAIIPHARLFSFKESPPLAVINTDAAGKINIHPLGKNRPFWMKMALSYQKGVIIKQGHFTKNSPFTKKGVFITFDLFESSNFSVHWLTPAMDVKGGWSMDGGSMV